MLLSRFWYLALAAAGAFALTATLLGQAAFNRQYDHQLGDQLRRDRFEIELLLRMDARTRIDAIAPLAAHQDVRTALRAASNRRDRRVLERETVQRLNERLRALNGQLEGMAADLLFAVDDQGYIVSQLGTADPPAGAALGAFPLVERALAGYLRDDVWLYNDAVYRMAARPVIDNGQYVGAIVHGKRFDDDFARRLSERIGGATVTFFVRDRVTGSHMPADAGAARADDIAAKLAEALADERLAEGGRTEPLDLASGGSRGVYSLVTGSASHAQAGYAIARPRKVLVGPLSLFDEVADEDVAALPWPIIAGSFVLAFLFGMAFLWLERDRPYGKLKRATAKLAQREVKRLDVAAHGGSYRKIAEAVNKALEATAEAAGAEAARKPADLDAILGPTGDGEKPPAFFGFADRGSATPGSIPPAPAGPPASGAKPPGPRPPGPGYAVPPGHGPPMPAPPGPRPYVPPSPGGFAAPPPPGPRPTPPGPPAGGAPSPFGAPPPSKPGWASGTMLGVGDGNAGGEGPVQAAGRPAALDEEEVATTIAPVPKELLNALDSRPEAPGDEEAHFREVFEQFVETKKQCGEATTGLTYAKFSQTLRKNRDQIVSRHAATRVRFTVYVKEGKAALKATPVK